MWISDIFVPFSFIFESISTIKFNCNPKECYTAPHKRDRLVFFVLNVFQNFPSEKYSTHHTHIPTQPQPNPTFFLYKNKIFSRRIPD